MRLGVRTTIRQKLSSELVGSRFKVLGPSPSFLAFVGCLQMCGKVQYEKIAMDWVMDFQPERYNVLMRRLVSQIDEGWWKELPLTLFNGLTSGIDALRFLQRAQQIGKVVLAQPSRMDCHPDGSYVLSSGGGSF